MNKDLPAFEDKKIDQIIDKFKGNDEIEPKWVFSELFRQFNNEFVHKSDNKENDIPFQNKVFNGLNDGKNS